MQTVYTPIHEGGGSLRIIILSKNCNRNTLTNHHMESFHEKNFRKRTMLDTPYISLIDGWGQARAYSQKKSHKMSLSMNQRINESIRMVLNTSHSLKRGNWHFEETALTSKQNIRTLIALLQLFTKDLKKTHLMTQHN